MLEMNLAVDESWPTSCIQNGGDYFIEFLVGGGCVVLGFLFFGSWGFFVFWFFLKGRWRCIMRLGLVFQSFLFSY